MTSMLHTEFSVYEVDQDAKKIRRLTSTHTPTPNQGNNGTWRDYQRLTWHGQRLLVTYGIDAEQILRQTLLSEVQQVDGDPLDILD